jgi:dipeptidyl aminopeptidase/acylaminoacyl peptidase
MDSKLPGDITLPSSKEELNKLTEWETGSFKYTVEDYFKRPDKYSFKFSPDGNYISYRKRNDNGKAHIYINDTSTGEELEVVQETDELIRGYAWANATRIIYVKDQGGDENYHLYAIDINGANAVDLTPFEGVRVSILHPLKEQKDFMIISMNKDNPEIFEPYKINVNTGQLEKLYENDDPQNPIADYDFDKDGQLRAYTKQHNGVDYWLYYRQSESSPFEVIHKGNWKDTHSIIGFEYDDANPHLAYMLSNLENDTNEIILYDLEKRQRVSKLHSDPVYDMGGMTRSRKRNYEVDYYYLNGEKYNIVPVSETFKKLHSRYTAHFDDKEVNVVDKTDNEDKFLLYVTSDRLYGIYYIYDVANDDFHEVMNLMPQLIDTEMAKMIPIAFEARDGLSMHGYLTLPNQASSDSKVPLIVNPHGGPYGPRDSWGFNPEAQLFASRGYATLQVNYRGSGGYGKTHFLAGNKQIGRKMLDDLEDGVAHVLTLGMVDPNHIAIYGGSYGGLATLGSMIKTPELYTCGVDYVGVSNLFTFVQSFPPYWRPFMAQFYEQWYDETNPEEKAIMEEVSPALHADKIRQPLFVVQGANDPRVNINESDQIVSNLRNRGVDVPYMVKYNEGHGFGHEENKIELYQCMMGFFAKHLKGEASS